MSEARKNLRQGTRTGVACVAEGGGLMAWGESISASEGCREALPPARHEKGDRP
jgi:cobyrinic acid a,c-diamide synthase